MMNPGTYYIGDLCYVMNTNWDELCDLTIDDNNNCKEGEFILGKIPFAMYNTLHGDGLYLDQNGSPYAVDSGSIGCVSIENLSQADLDAASKYSKLITFDQAFTTKNIDGVIHIGHIVIDTTQ